jgi:hypothetical protein
MKRFTASAALLVVCGGMSFGLDNSPPGKKMQYRHITSTGNECSFVLDQGTGTASYIYNGQRIRGDLAFIRTEKIQDPGDRKAYEGWVYQVKGRNLWFFFGDTPIVTGTGDRVYPMYYTTTLREKNTPWVRILTPGGTRRTAVDGKGSPPEITRKELAEIARQAIRDKTVRVERTYKRAEGKVLSYYLGHLPVRPRGALDCAASLQLQVEVIRHLFPGKNDRALWNPYLREVEKIIGEELEGEKRNRQTDKQRLEEDVSKAWNVFQQGFQNWGRKNGFERVSPQAEGFGMWPVRTIIRPEMEGVEVFYLKWYSYYKLKKSGRLKELDVHSRPLPPKGELQTGDYFFWAKWDGRTSPPKGAPIDSTNQTVYLTLRPKS